MKFALRVSVIFCQIKQILPICRKLVNRDIRASLFKSNTDALAFSQDMGCVLNSVSRKDWLSKSLALTRPSFVFSKCQSCMFFTAAFLRHNVVFATLIAHRMQTCNDCSYKTFTSRCLSFSVTNRFCRFHFAFGEKFFIRLPRGEIQ